MLAAEVIGPVINTTRIKGQVIGALHCYCHHKNDVCMLRSPKVRTRCKEVVKERGVENITVDDLVAEVTPEARRLVPDKVKRELLLQIKTFLAEKSGIKDL